MYACTKLQPSWQTSDFGTKFAQKISLTKIVEK